MTALRMAAHRAGWLEVMVPQAVEVWARDRTHLTHVASDTASHHVADQLLHLGYGAAAGSLYAGLSRRQPPSATRAVAFGSLLWAFGSALLFPALRIARPLWRASAREELVNFGAHALYGAVTVYLVDELERQRATQPKSWLGVQRARVG
jgi:hypothetical protein